MREELNRSLVFGNVSVEDAIAQVEEELSRWQCSRYFHITRAMGVSEDEHPIIELETIFSKPTQDKPVPVAVVCVHFCLETETGRITYRFEEESVEHEVGGRGLAPGMFEKWLDRIIGDKLQVRELHDLATAFEETRLEPPPLLEEYTSEVQQSEDQRASEEDAAGLAALETAVAAGMAPARELPLSDLLSNIFDAADEEDEFELTHKEVADLLYATPLGLADWDIKLLLTTAAELDTGRIEYKPFVQAAPEIIEALMKRRAAFEERQKDALSVTQEAIELCFGEEIEEVTRAAREAFASVDTSGKGTLSRHQFRSSLMSRIERFSMQEVQMLMQMCKEDDFGQVPYDDFNLLLQQLRVDALHNALVETDIGSLRVHLILLARREGLRPQDDVMKVWDLRNVLLCADQLCLSRMQIHVILSIVHPDEFGFVDIEYFLRVCCTVIPHMFDTTAFAEKASTIAKEKADALAKQELEELQGIASSSLAAKRRVDDEDLEDAQANAPDRDAVEKALIHVGNQADEKHRQHPTLEERRFLEVMRNDAVQQCQLSEAELRGFIAEAEIDERGEVAYVDHIKTWVPIVFELRRSRIYDGILAKDWGFNASHLVDLSEFESQFPLRGFQETEPHQPSRPSSAASNRSYRQGHGSKAASGRETPGQGSRRSINRSASLTGQGRRPSSRGPNEKEQRPSSRSNKRRGSKKGGLHRANSSRSLQRSNSQSSVESHASHASHATDKSRLSIASRG
mmetsp:Transcript_93733/g.201191  ORF Transcript_93733/g.201191 Transcript_93733/m.201191 type:complete len:743 (-) Transcript_93733:80-2308(-)